MAFVQSNFAYNSGPVTETGIAAGGCLVAYIQGNSSLATTTLPSPWVKQTPVANSGTFACQWVYPNHAGGSLSSAITNAPGDCGWSIHEYSGRDTTTPVEDADGVGGNADNLQVTVTCTAGADVVGGGGQETSAFTCIYDAPATKRTGIDDHVHATGDITGVSAGNVTIQGDFWTTGQQAVHLAVSLKAAGGGGGTVSLGRRRRPSLIYR